MSSTVGRAVDGRDRSGFEESVIDGVLSVQPELGPSVPDGGFGWFVFSAILFFQAIIPSLAVSFGIFLTFSRGISLSKEDTNPKLWDDNFIYVPLCFTSCWTLFDPLSRDLISNSKWPRLVATAGTCLTCAGLLFLWMGLTGYGSWFLYVLSGIVTGLGASIQISQCEILLAQYFKLKHAILVHISQAVTSVGFILAPIIIGRFIIETYLLNVILWYQAVILQGLILNLLFRKPMYLKSLYREAYNYVTTNPEDEEDIFSKNSRELQIKRQNSNDSQITIEKHEIAPAFTDDDLEAGTSQENSSSSSSPTKKNWETFKDDDEDDKNEKSPGKDWETFEEEEGEVELGIAKEKNGKKEWIKFEDEEKDKETKRNEKNLQLELSFADNSKSLTANSGPRSSVTGNPMPLFSDLPVNNNTTYSYEVLDQNGARPAVFMPTTIQRRSSVGSLEILRKPTFYKSLLTVMTTKFSLFVYYTLFPSYLYQEMPKLHLRSMSTVVGLLSVSGLLFSLVSYWVNVDKRRRPICLWLLCWAGSFGYFMVSESNTQSVLLFGAIQITLSISALQYIGLPLLGLTVRGETNKEFGLISVMTGNAFLFFVFINASFKDCFRLMAILHFFTGAVWFSNYIYKRILKV